MRYKMLTTIVVIISVVITSCDGIGISSKLDFGDADSAPAIIGSASQYRTIPNHAIKGETKTSGNFDGIGVVCTSGGCNTTTANETSDSIQTDIVVHVKTSVDVNKNKTNPVSVDENDDVPVVVGNGGTNLHPSSQRRTFNQKPIIVNDFSSPSFIPSYPSYSTPRLESDSVYVQKSDSPRVDINIKTLPPVTFQMLNDERAFKDVRYDTNGLEVRYPYFQPSLQTHYYGENPPPQLVWSYPKSATWKPSFWGNATPRKHTHTGPTCTCNRPPTGLQWHPSRSSVYGTDPGSQIDDKLAPLN